MKSYAELQAQNLSHAFSEEDIKRVLLHIKAHLYLEARVDEETLKKVVLHSVATALASIVFPVPGGPNIRTPCREHNSQKCQLLVVARMPSPKGIWRGG